MKDHKELSLKVANAVMKQIENDRSINRNNIQEAVQKELAVHEPEQTAIPGLGLDVLTLARDLVDTLVHERGVPYSILKKASDLLNAIKQQKI